MRAAHRTFVDHRTSHRTLLQLLRIDRTRSVAASYNFRIIVQTRIHWDYDEAIFPKLASARIAALAC